MGGSDHRAIMEGPRRRSTPARYGAEETFAGSGLLLRGIGRHPFASGFSRVRESSEPGGVTVYRRLSPLVLIDLMKVACEQSARFHQSLDPFAPATFAVSWAGEEKSLNWFDTARELTERWHHQQQIRLATDRPGIMTPDLYHPVLDCFVRGLPFLYRDVDASVGTIILVEISGDCGGKWLVAREAAGWVLVRSSTGRIASRVTIPQALAWRLFTKGIDRHSARAQVEIDGDRDLGEKVLNLTAIVA